MFRVNLFRPQYSSQVDMKPKNRGLSYSPSTASAETAILKVIADNPKVPVTTISEMRSLSQRCQLDRLQNL